MHTLFKSTDGNKLVLDKANCDYDLAGICTYLDIPFFFFLYRRKCKSMYAS